MIIKMVYNISTQGCMKVIYERTYKSSQLIF